MSDEAFHASGAAANLVLFRGNSEQISKADKHKVQGNEKCERSCWWFCAQIEKEAARKNRQEKKRDKLNKTPRRAERARGVFQCIRIYKSFMQLRALIGVELNCVCL